MHKTHHYRLRLLLFTVILFVVSIVCFYMEFELHDGDDFEPVKVIIEEDESETSGMRINEIQLMNNTFVKQGIKADVMTDRDRYLLAKIAMAEAEGESFEGKVLVMNVILNRVKSNEFPDTIEEVIFEERNGTYQFSPLKDGRFYNIEPNEECWAAVELVESGCYKGTDALYFSSSKEASNWHSRNLEFLFQLGNHKFYK